MKSAAGRGGSSRSSRRDVLKYSGAAAITAASFPMPALASSPTVIRFSSNQPHNSIYTRAMQMVADEADRLSDGGLEVRLFPGGQLGDANQMQSALLSGTQHIGISTPGWFSTSVPQVNVFAMPYIVSSPDRLRSALNGRLGEKIFEGAERVGLKFHGGWLMGARSLANNIRPIHEPDDLRDLKLRVIGSDVYLETFGRLGATPISMAPSELYLALQHNVLDGFEYPLPDLLDAKLYEVSAYLSLDEHVTDFFILGMNMGVWNGLSSEEQEIFSEALGTATDWLWAEQPANIAAADARLRELMTVNDISAENKQKFIDATRPVYGLFADAIGPDLMELAIAELGPADS